MARELEYERVVPEHLTVSLIIEVRKNFFKHLYFSFYFHFWFNKVINFISESFPKKNMRLRDFIVRPAWRNHGSWQVCYHQNTIEGIQFFISELLIGPQVRGKLLDHNWFCIQEI